MFLLRREYRDGTEHPDIVFLHAEVDAGGANPVLPSKATRVVVPTADPGRRVTHIALPDPP
jgi:hypothetical protein